MPEELSIEELVKMSKDFQDMPVDPPPPLPGMKHQDIPENWDQEKPTKKHSTLLAAFTGALLGAFLGAFLLLLSIAIVGRKTVDTEGYWYNQYASLLTILASNGMLYIDEDGMTITDQDITVGFPRVVLHDIEADVDSSKPSDAR